MKKTIGLTIAAIALAGSTAVVIAADKGVGAKDCNGGGWGKHHKSGGYDRHGKGSMMGAKMLNVLDWELELTAEQRDQIRSLMKDQQAQKGQMNSPKQNMRKSMMELDPGSADYQEQVKQLAQQQADQITQRMTERAETYAAIYAVLTPEQQQTFKELKGQWGKKWSQPRGQGQQGAMKQGN
ncbi:Spy/CpxP family protein refolding chaperone [Motiliproteus sp. MSK22-1]|uniref:Spy/CpxP family protein refolding chaperone n=1 Tax=Motiliproteus sp. MSK22-1 TaxID=1897630 RepID=UPI000977FEB9|nr:Spy/CpxP family protein refolding chaperone [Motiliproteus sp. MSK22-1]OMH38953.1 hypothetical protein BGP75_04300 [Motiliproteus sp. MSK22-1]